MKKIYCRMCKNTNLNKFLDLGHSALSDNFLTADQLSKPETSYPLDVYSCDDCGLCQLGYVVAPELMFNEEYSYDSSTTKTGTKHFTSMGINISERFELTSDSLVIDIGSNTGVLLSGFKSKGVKVLGVEPSSKVADIAISNGIDTIKNFFSIKVAEIIIQKYGKVSIITGTNVFAHIDNLDDFLIASDKLLTENGIIVLEAPYLVDLLDNLEYDTIYHEHLSYLSLKPIMNFLQKFEMEVFDVEWQNIHGGSMRYFIGRKGVYKVSQKIEEYLNVEKEKGVYSKERLYNFGKDVEKHRSELISLLIDLKRQGKKIVGISAPAKGNTLLNYCRIGPEILEYITERNPLKFEKYTPGTHIKIFPDEVLLKDKPDYALILAWNFADEIIKNNSEFRNNGGKFIIPIPHPKIL